MEGVKSEHASQLLQASRAKQRTKDGRDFKSGQGPGIGEGDVSFANGLD